MNRLDTTNNGGHPFTGDDLEFLQASFLQGISGSLSAFDLGTLSPVIISGINLVNSSGTTWTWQDGYVYINKEIYKIDAGSVTLTTGILVWALATTYDTPGEDTYEDSSFHHTHIVNKVVIQQASSTLFTPPAITPTMNDVIISNGNLVVDHSTSWQTPSFVNSWTNGNSAGSAVRYKKNIDGSVSFDGWAIKTTSIALNEVMFTLPAAYRPLKDKIFILQGGDSAWSAATLLPVCIAILTTGDVQIFTSGLTTGKQIALDNINFPLN